MALSWSLPFQIQRYEYRRDPNSRTNTNVRVAAVKWRLNCCWRVEEEQTFGSYLWRERYVLGRACMRLHQNYWGQCLWSDCCDLSPLRVFMMNLGGKSDSKTSDKSELWVLRILSDAAVTHTVQGEMPEQCYSHRNNSAEKLKRYWCRKRRMSSSMKGF